MTFTRNTLEPLSPEALERLAKLATNMSGLLPLRLAPTGSTVVLRDQYGSALADMGTGGSGVGRYIAFDRYIRDACNAAPALIAELRDLRQRVATIRAETLEMCATACDDVYGPASPGGRRLRALKETP